MSAIFFQKTRQLFKAWQNEETCPETPVARACFPNVAQFCHTGSIVSSINFVSKPQNLLLLHGRNISCFRPRGIEAWQNEETITETCFLVLPGPYGSADENDLSRD